MIKKTRLTTPCQNLVLIILLSLLLPPSFTQAQFSTEGFESFTAGNTSFTSNCQPFTLTSNFEIARWEGLGYGPSDQYFDNANNCLGSAGIIGSITSTDNAGFNVTSLWLYPSENCTSLGTNGTAIIRGKNGGSTQFTHTVLSGDWNTLQGTNNGFTFIDLSANAGTEIDELEFEVTGSLRYLAIDDFRWQTTLTADPATSTIPSSVTTYTSTISKTDGNGWTHYADQDDNLLLSIKIGSSGAVIPCGGVSVQKTASSATHYSTGTGFITNPEGAVFFNRSWNVQPSVQPGSSVPVRFYFTAAEYAAVNTELGNQGMSPLSDPSEMLFYKATNGSTHASISSLSGNDIIELTNGTASTIQWSLGSVGSDYYAEFHVSSFSGGGGGSAGSGSSFFPVEFLSFTGKRSNQQVILNWTTASESNSASFQVQRSFDQVHFEGIGEVAAAGHSTKALAYQFKDHKPGKGTCFYRLKQIDFDGQFMYSSIIEVVDDAEADIRVFPNPFRNQLRVQVPFHSNVKTMMYFQLFDANGRLVASQNWKNDQRGEKQLTIHQSLPEGIYYYSITDGKQYIKGKLLRSK